MRTVVGVLRGGPSSEYDVSLKTGASVLKALDREKYDSRDIFISRDGSWHVHGAPAHPEKALKGIDVVFNAMHGHYGEDGQVQRVLDGLGVPYTGSDAFSSAIAFNKHHTKEAVRKAGVKIVHGKVVERPPEGTDLEALAFDIFRTFPHPAIVKPVIGGSAIATTIADNFHSLAHALEQAFKVSDRALIEEFIKGKEATVGVIDHFRGERAYALMPVEIVPPAGHPFFTYESRYGGGAQEICPGSFSRDEKEDLAHFARLVHETLDLSHYSRSDFIVSRRGIYFLEVNTLPGLTEHSLLPKALHAVGAPFSHFLDHVIGLAKGRV